MRSTLIFPRAVSFKIPSRTTSTERCGKSSNARSGITTRFYKIAPNWRRPTRIIGVPADYMQMELRYDVADCGKVDFANGKFILYKARSHCGFAYRHIPDVFW